MTERAPYSRVYWTIVDDPKFATIYDDDHHLAAWLRMLLIAEQAHPASAPLPVGVRKSSVVALTEARLIVVTGSRFRISGLDAEREKRTESARNAAASRWQSDRIPVPDAGGMPRRGRDETRLDEDTAREPDDKRADLEAFLLVTRRAPTPRQRQLLDGVLALHDVTGPQWTADIILRNPTDPIGAVIVADKAWRSERIDAAKAVERPKPKPKPHRSRGLPESAREVLEHWAAQEREKAAQAKGSA